jgi:hypothetical protein
MAAFRWRDFNVVYVCVAFCVGEVWILLRMMRNNDD